MPALKLFVSHSSNLDETDAQGRPLSRNWELLKETCNAIRGHYGSKIEILVDFESLMPADDWRARIHLWLGDCDVAIVLFSKRALAESSWVKFEASVLGWRRSRDPAFKLIPVLLEGETAPGDLEKDVWDAIGIGDNQCIRSAASGAQILAGLRTVLGDLDQSDSTAFATRFRAVRALMEECANHAGHQQSLREAWDSVSGAHVLPTWPADAIGRYALGLTRLLFENTAESVRAFKRLVENMHPPFQRTLELFRYVRPLWVDAVAAECFFASSHQYPFLALNGEYVCYSDPDLATDCYTLDRYLERAALRRGDIRVVQVPAAEADAILDEIRTSIDRQWHTSDKRRELVDRRLRQAGAPLVALVPATDGLPDPRLIDQLRDLRDRACPRLVYVFSTGAAMPSETPPDVRAVLPALDPEREYDHYLDERDVHAAISGA